MEPENLIHMLPLRDRLDALTKVLEASISDIYQRSPHTATKTGFEPYSPRKLANVVCELSRYHIADHASERSFDLGCGVGTWALLTAAAGIPSFGMDANEELVAWAIKNAEEARAQGLIPEDVPLRFVTGNLFPKHRWEEYHTSSVPQAAPPYRAEWERISPPCRVDAYGQLQISLSDATLAYNWPWPTQREAIPRMIHDETPRLKFFITPVDVDGIFSRIPSTRLQDHVWFKQTQ